MLMLHDIKHRPEDGSDTSVLIPDIVNSIKFLADLWTIALSDEGTIMGLRESALQNFGEAICELATLTYYLSKPTDGDTIDYEVAAMAYHRSHILTDSMNAAMEFMGKIPGVPVGKLATGKKLHDSINFVGVQLKTMALVCSGRFAVTEVEVKVDATDKESASDRGSNGDVPGNPGDVSL